MSYRSKILRQIPLILFIACLAVQGWRGLAMNSWNITKSFFQLRDIDRSDKSVVSQNHKMLLELKKIKSNPDLMQALKASRELNLVEDPEKEIIINFSE
jgi:hypothetical protein